MHARSLLKIAMMALAPLAGASPSSAAVLSDYNVQKAETWADALAICDVTKFLLTEPKLDSEVIIAAVPGGAPVALRGPYFIPPSGFYSEVMKETFERVRTAGQVTPEAYNEARTRYTKLMFSAYTNASANQAFLNDQMRVCYALAVDTTGRARKPDKAH